MMQPQLTTAPVAAPGGQNFKGPQKTAVGDLEVGMFVAELDRPWLETPFLIQGFEIRHRSQIKTLMSHCRHVYVSRERSRMVGGEKTLAPAGIRAQIHDSKTDGNLYQVRRWGKPARQRLLRSRPAGGNVMPVEREHAAAREVYARVRIEIEEMLRSVSVEQMLDTERAQQVVAACAESILRNPNALLWMAKIKRRDEYIAEHSLDVCILSIAFGQHLGYDGETLQLLGLCGLLHDVGKMAIKPEILYKSSPFDPSEAEYVRRHTAAGYKLLAARKGLHKLVLDVALNHHERVDGTGYPRGLRGHEIAEFTRIISVVDAYDTMISGRSYAAMRTPYEAQKILYANRGTQFDEEITLQFIRVIGPYPPGTLVQLCNGMVGAVLAGRHKFRHLPTVVVVRDENGARIPPLTLDLSLTDRGELDKKFLIKKVLKDGECGVHLRNLRVESSSELTPSLHMTKIPEASGSRLNLNLSINSLLAPVVQRTGSPGRKVTCGQELVP